MGGFEKEKKNNYTNLYTVKSKGFGLLSNEIHLYQNMVL